MLGLWQTVSVTHWPLQPQQDPQDKVLTKSVLSTLWEGMQTPRLDWSFIWELMILQSRCSVCGKQCLSRIGLFSHSKTHKIKVLTKSVLSTLWEGMQLQDWTVKSSENSRLNRAHSRCVWQTVPVTRIGLFIHSKSHKTKSSPKVFCPHWEGMQLQDWNGESSIC